MSRKRERGVALLATLAVIALLASYFLVSRLNAESGGVTAANRIRNAAVLNKAKQALISYVAQQAATAGERNPGRLPCPEAVNSIGTSSDGISAPWVGPPNTSTCASIGRLPWRTLGLDKLLDAAGEPLWYAVGPVWRLTNSSSTLQINSDTAGDVLVDGQQVVALVIAPGGAMNVQASPGCAARNQSRGAPAPTMEALDYLECFDTATLQFVTTAPGTSFNDQVVRVTVADIMPAIEAAIANRIEREIAPVLKIVYADTQWGAGISPATPLFPFAVPFDNPGPGAGTSSFQGAAGTYQGLLPFNQTQGCAADPANPRCLPSLVQWSAAPAGPVEVLGYGYIQGTPSCTPPFSPTMSQWECTGEYHEDDATMPLPVEPWQSIRIEMTATFTNVAMGLRAIDTTKMTVEARDDVALGPWQPQTVSYTATMNDGSILGKPVGSVTITFGATLPNIDVMGWGTYAQFRIRLERAVIGDHALLSSTDSTTGWFVRNEWYRLAYYSVARGHTADKLPPVCPTTVPFSSSCLSVANVAPAGAQRAILILAGGSVNGTARPNATPGNYLEFGNATGAFERQTVRASAATPVAQRFNDRIVAIDSN